MSNNYEERWEIVISSVPSLKDKTKAVFLFLRLFKEGFDGNGPTLEEISRMLSETYDREYSGRKIGDYYLRKLTQMGLVEIVKSNLSSRTPGRVIIKEGEWSYLGHYGRVVDQDNNNNHETTTGSVPKENTIEPHCDLVGETSLLRSR